MHIRQYMQGVQQKWEIAYIIKGIQLLRMGDQNQMTSVPTQINQISWVQKGHRISDIMDTEDDAFMGNIQSWSCFICRVKILPPLKPFWQLKDPGECVRICWRSTSMIAARIFISTSGQCQSSSSPSPSSTSESVWPFRGVWWELPVTASHFTSPWLELGSRPPKANAK